MEINKLKNAAKTIKMPQDMRERIAARTKKVLVQERSGVKTKRPAVIAALLAACICLSAVGVALGNAGFFSDITGTDGAVVGTAYEQATEEIAVSAVVDGNVLKVVAVFLAPDRAPYSEIDALAIGNYRITNEADATAAEGNGTASVSIAGGKAEFMLPLDAIAPGTYTLQIDAFTGSKKADQPLGISGAWECAFRIP